MSVLQLQVKPHQSGLTLLVMVVLLLLGGFTLAQVNNAGRLQQELHTLQHARKAIILDQIRAGLLGFAANQGIHSQSHLGHLPCPAKQPGSFPETTCLGKPWGYLAVQSKTAINYLNQGIDARNNELEPSARHDWQYAVSAQLIQPNSLGWSRWVDYSQPSMNIVIPSEGNRTEQQIAAVVAHSIEPVGQHNFIVNPPYMLIRVNELRAHMTAIQTHLIKNTLETWQETATTSNSAVLAHENMKPLSGSQNIFQPVDSECSCRCTKTRCTCNCSVPGQWKSMGKCLGANENCLDKEVGAICNSNTGESCLFSGPASLQNDWPVSRFEPVAASNKSCRPSFRSQCPLSTNTQPCTCDFSWPDNTKNNLNNYTVTKTPAQSFEAKVVQP